MSTIKLGGKLSALGPATTAAIVLTGTMDEMFRNWTNTGKICRLVEAAFYKLFIDGELDLPTEPATFEYGMLDITVTPLVQNGRAKVYKITVTNLLLDPNDKRGQRAYRYINYGNGAGSFRAL